MRIYTLLQGILHNEEKMIYKIFHSMKRTIFISILLFFMMGLIHNLGHPITPGLLRELKLPDYLFGTYFALMSFGLVIGGPFWGTLGDHKDKRKLIFVGLLIYSVGQFVFGNVHNIYIMAIARFVSGFGVSAIVTLLMTYLIQKSDPSKTKRNVAFGLAAMALGASVGYKIGGLLPELLQSISDTSAGESIFMLQAIINVFLGILVMFALQPCTDQLTTKKPSFFQTIKGIKDLDRNLLIFLTSLTFVSIGAINISKYLEVYIQDIGQGSKGIGDFVFVTGIVSITATVLIVPQIIKLKRDIYIMIIINIISGIVIFAVFQISNIMFALYSVFMIYVVMKAIYAPLETAYISSYAKDGEYGKIMGIRQFFFAIGFVIGPLIGGFIYGIEEIYVFYFSVIMFIIAAVLVLSVYKKIDVPKNDE